MKKEREIINKFEWKAVNRTRKEEGLIQSGCPVHILSAAYIQEINKNACKTS